MIYNIEAWEKVHQDVIEKLFRKKGIDDLIPFILDIVYHNERTMRFANEITQNYQMANKMIEGYHKVIFSESNN